MSSSHEICIESRLNEKIRNIDRFSPPRNENAVDGLMIVHGSIGYCGRIHVLPRNWLRQLACHNILSYFVNNLSNLPCRARAHSSCNDSVVFIRVRVHSHSHVPSDVSARSYYESMIVGVLHHENIWRLGYAFFVIHISLLILMFAVETEIHRASPRPQIRLFKK